MVAPSSKQSCILGSSPSGLSAADDTTNTTVFVGNLASGRNISSTDLRKSFEKVRNYLCLLCTCTCNNKTLTHSLLLPLPLTPRRNIMHFVLFSQVGTVEDVRYTTGNKFGFVKFSNHADAARAIDVMGGMEIKVIDDPPRRQAGRHLY